MELFIDIAAFLVILLFLPLMVYSISPKPIVLRKKCSKNPEKMCSITETISSSFNKGYQISFDGQFQCCKFKDQLKALDKLIISSDKNDGKVLDIHFAKHLRDEAKKRGIKWEKVDSSGPIE